MLALLQTVTSFMHWYTSLLFLIELIEPIWQSRPNSEKAQFSASFSADPVLYWSFETVDNLFVMEGNTQIDFDPRVVGKVEVITSFCGDLLRYRQWSASIVSWIVVD